MSVKPVRLQRRRKKGFKLVSPNGLPVLYVGRGSRWGNPYIVGVHGDAKEVVEKYRLLIEHIFDGLTGVNIPVMQYQLDYCVGAGQAPILRTETIFSLRGYNLSCWCPLDKPCHADVLLDAANAPVDLSVARKAWQEEFNKYYGAKK
jgi:hypothetical protein